MTRYFCILGAMIVVLASFAASQTAVDQGKVQTLAQAIAKAEGFGVRGTIPTRTHNPGDIRSRKGWTSYAGQVGLNHSGYVIFKNDRYGWLALENHLVRMATGQSKHFKADMTLTQVSKIYSPGGWQNWSRNLSKRLGVPASTTLQTYFDIPPALPVVGDSKVLAGIFEITPVVPNLAIDPDTQELLGMVTEELNNQKVFDRSVLDQIFRDDQENPQRQTNLI